MSEHKKVDVSDDQQPNTPPKASQPNTSSTTPASIEPIEESIKKSPDFEPLAPRWVELLAGDIDTLIKALDRADRLPLSGWLASRLVLGNRQPSCA